MNELTVLMTAGTERASQARYVSGANRHVAADHLPVHLLAHSLAHSLAFVRCRNN